MYCVHCGKTIEDNSKFCEYCGQKVPEELVQKMQSVTQPVQPVTQPAQPVQPVQPAQTVQPAQPEAAPQKKSNKKLIITIIAIALAAIVLLVATIGFITVITGLLEAEGTPSWGENSTSALHDSLTQTWTKSGTITQNFYTYDVKYTLEITENTITCSYTLFDEENTITAFRYETISGDQIQRVGADTTYTITFSNNKSAMTILPALSTNEASETWYLESSGSSQQTEAGQNATVSSAEKEALIQKLKKSWTRTDGANGYYTEHELFFSDTWFSHNYTSTLGDSAGSNYDFEVISGNQIREIYTDVTYTLTFNEAENVMTISPAISSTASSEQWFYMGD